MPEDIEKLGFIDEISPRSGMRRLPLQMVNVGMYYQPPGAHPNPREIRTGHEVVEIVTGGRGWIEEQGEWLEVTPGALLWHVEGERTIARSDWADPYRCLALRFQVPEQAEPRIAPRFTHWHDSEEIAHFSREVIRWYVDDAFDRDALLQYTYGRLLFQVQLWLRQQGSDALLPVRLKAALEWINGHVDHPLSLQNVAREVGWSPSHLHEMFRLHLGTTPHRYLLERRIRRAKERLTATNSSVKEIAAASGFSSAAAFCHAFRQHVGLTPLAYRRQMVPGASR